MATVFVARARGALGFQRLVALKRAHPHVRDDAELAASLRLEATLAGSFRHPNVVAVIDVQEADGEIELILDYVEGVTLTELLRACEDTGNFAAMTRIVLDVAAGLAAAHAATREDGAPLGVVHRDVTPSNVLVGTDGVARISDFGIAHATLREGAHTATGVLKGKVGYMAPEYVERYRADAASDQFSLAVVAWEALSGKRLFKGPTELETLKRVVVANVPPLAETDPRLAPLDGVLSRALARRPEDRFAGVAAFAAKLEEVARGASLVASHAAVAELVKRVAHATLEERKKKIAEAGAPSSPAAPPSQPVPSARDLMPTASVVVPRESVPVAPEPPSSTDTVSRTVDVAPPRARGPWLLAGGASLALVVLAGIVALRGANEAPGAAVPSAATTEGDAGPVPTAAPSVIELVDEPSPSPTDAGKKPNKAPLPVHPPLVPTKAPPNPYKPKR